MTKDLRHTPRLFIPSELQKGAPVLLDEAQTHYLVHVLRAKPGYVLRMFNGRDGEWRTHVANVSKRSIDILVDEQTRPPGKSRDLTLFAAPIKKAHFDYMIEKATELGIACFQPILTERAQIREVNKERCALIATEAAEQADRLDVPEIQAPYTLMEMIAKWSPSRLPLVCAEWGEALQAHDAFEGTSVRGAESVGVIVGPEGGFSATELEALRHLPSSVFVRLGSRVLRADTAALAALTLWQSSCGDWRNQ